MRPASTFPSCRLSGPSGSIPQSLTLPQQDSSTDVQNHSLDLESHQPAAGGPVESQHASTLPLHTLPSFQDSVAPTAVPHESDDARRPMFEAAFRQDEASTGGAQPLTSPGSIPTLPQLDLSGCSGFLNPEPHIRLSPSVNVATSIVQQYSGWNVCTDHSPGMKTNSTENFCKIFLENIPWNLFRSELRCRCTQLML